MKKLVVPLALCGLACLAPAAMAESTGAGPAAPLCRLSDGPAANQEAKAGYWMMVDPGGDVIPDPGTKPGRFWELTASDDVIPGGPGKQGNFWELPGSDDVLPGDPGKRGNFWELQSADDPHKAD